MIISFRLSWVYINSNIEWFTIKDYSIWKYGEITGWKNEIFGNPIQLFGNFEIPLYSFLAFMKPFYTHFFHFQKKIHPLFNLIYLFTEITKFLIPYTNFLENFPYLYKNEINKVSPYMKIAWILTEMDKVLPNPYKNGKKILHIHVFRDLRDPLYMYFCHYWPPLQFSWHFIDPLYIFLLFSGTSYTTSSPHPCTLLNGIRLVNTKNGLR